MIAEATGGTLRFAALGGLGGPLDPRNITSVLGYHAVIGIYDFVSLHGTEGLEIGMAESITSNEDATLWTISLRPNAVFHDGRPVRAADLDYSIRFFGDWETSPTFATYFLDVDFENMGPIDEQTLEIPLFRPRADFLESILALYLPIVPEGAQDFDLPVGSGPFRIVSNDGADGYEMVRNEDWWGPRPALDRVVTVPINDPTARINALKTGEVDFAYQLPPTIALSEQDNEDITIEQTPFGGAAMCFVMNTTFAPFDNPEVREAMRLVIDREALLNAVLLGQGVLGNDLVGLGMHGYHDGLPQRTRDLDRATELFAAAGVNDLHIVASDIVPGLVSSAELLGGMLAEAGVSLSIEEVPPDAFFGDFARLLSTPFQTIYIINRPPGVHMPSFVGSTAVFNPTAYAPPELDEAIFASQSEVDPEQREMHLHRAQQLEWENGGMIIWGYSPMILAYSNSISNVNLVSDGLVKFHDLVISA